MQAPSLGERVSKEVETGCASCAQLAGHHDSCGNLPDKCTRGLPDNGGKRKTPALASNDRAVSLQGEQRCASLGALSTSRWGAARASPLTAAEHTLGAEKAQPGVPLPGPEGESTASILSDSVPEVGRKEAAPQSVWNSGSFSSMLPRLRRDYLGPKVNKAKHRSLKYLLAGWMCYDLGLDVPQASCGHR